MAKILLHYSQRMEKPIAQRCHKKVVKLTLFLEVSISCYLSPCILSSISFAGPPCQSFSLANHHRVSMKFCCLHPLLGLFSVYCHRRRMISGTCYSIKCCLTSDSGPDPPSHVACSAMWNIITLIIFFLRMSEGC